MKPKVPVFLVLILSLFLSYGVQQEQWRTCIKVIDGDTIVLDGDEKVRLIGVDTPEAKDPRKPVQYFGQEASEFTRILVEGKRVRLEFDQDRVDKYGRTLAYVYLEDGTFVNAEIIKQGYGFAYTQFPFKYLEEFRGYEKEARENNRCLWAPKEEIKPKDQIKANEDTIVYITKTGKKYHSENCRYLSKSKIPISLKEAVEKGYAPCSVCGPPSLQIVQKLKAADENEQITVYITKTGSKYHRASCTYLRKSSIPISLKDAVARGYTPCSICNPPTLKQDTPSTSSVASSFSSSSSGRTILTGPRGGKYYINKKGKKVYIKKKK